MVAISPVRSAGRIEAVGGLEVEHGHLAGLGDHAGCVRASVRRRRCTPRARRRRAQHERDATAGWRRARLTARRGRGRRRRRRRCDRRRGRGRRRSVVVVGRDGASSSVGAVAGAAEARWTTAGVLVGVPRRAVSPAGVNVNVTRTFVPSATVGVDVERARHVAEAGGRHLRRRHVGPRPSRCRPGLPERGGRGAGRAVGRRRSSCRCPATVRLTSAGPVVSTGEASTVNVAALLGNVVAGEPSSGVRVSTTRNWLALSPIAVAGVV